MAQGFPFFFLVATTFSFFVIVAFPRLGVVLLTFSSRWIDSQITTLSLHRPPRPKHAQTPAQLLDAGPWNSGFPSPLNPISWSHRGTSFCFFLCYKQRSGSFFLHSRLLFTGNVPLLQRELQTPRRFLLLSEKTSSPLPTRGSTRPTVYLWFCPPPFSGPRFSFLTVFYPFPGFSDT